MAKSAAKKPAKKKAPAKKKPAKKAASKKKPASKKAPKKGKKSDIDDIDAEIEKDLGEEFDFDASDTLEGKTVSFEDNDGETITGTVSEDGGEATVEVEGDDAFYDVKRSELTVVGAADEDDSEEEEEEAEEEEEEAEEEDDSEEEEEEEDEEDDEEAEEDEEDDEEAEEASDAPEIRLVALSDVKTPRDKPRDVDPETPKFKRMLADVKKRGIRRPIMVESFDKMVLEDGLRRLTIAGLLEFEMIPVMESGQTEDKQDRLWNGTLDNVMSEEMHWVDLAQTFAKLIKGDKYTQRKISRAFGFTETQVSRMTTALKSKKLIAIARQPDCQYSDGVFLELASASKGVQKEVLKGMTEGRHITIKDVRATAKAEKAAAKKAKGNDEEPGDEEPGKADPRHGAATRTLTSHTLSHDTLGNRIRVQVRRDEIEVKINIDHDKKTFRGKFDLLAEIASVFDDAFSDEETKCESFKALFKEMSAARSELVKND